MPKPQIITTPSGDRMVVIPLAEYERLVEMAEDREDIEAVQAFDAAMARGEEEMIPAEIVNRILDGENKVRLWREHRGMSARELAEKAGVREEDLSRMEAGKRETVIETLRKIATALSVDIDDIA